MLLTRRNDIKLVDLGVAKMVEKSHAETHEGTVPYMSPEVFKAKFMDDIVYYPNTDIW
jgi:serine/threonine protein kinase